MTISDLIGVIAQTDPQFPETIRGASEKEIRTLEALVGRQLPTTYQEFLRLMGHGTGWIKIGYDTTTDVSRLIEYYSEYVKSGKEFVPDGCIAISVFGVDLDVCLEVRDPGEPRVVFTEANQIYKPYADSLGQLLFRLAFFYYLPRRWRAYQKYWSPDPAKVLVRACDLALSLNFEPLWFSDSVAWCGERLDAAVGLRQYEQEGILVAVGAAMEADLVKIGEDFTRAVGVRPER